MNPKQQCKACKFQNKECKEECIFAPLFPSTSDPRKFEVINTNYGLETLSFFLKDLSPQERIATVNTFYSEAGSSCFDDDRVHDGPHQQVSEEPNKLIKEDKRETRQVVLALPAMSQRHLWVDPSDDYDTEITEEYCPNESLEPSVNAESKANK